MSQKLFCVIPECYVDTNLIEYLIDAKVNHQHSCTKVVGLLKNQYKDEFAIGIIDKDKVQLGYIQECDEIATTKHLTLLKHKSRSQFLITIKPAVDRFILDCAEEEGIDLKEYDLPAKLKEFTKESKSVTSNSDDRFKSLFKAITFSGSREFLNLKSSLEYMIQNRYNTDLSILKAKFEAP